MIIPTQAAYPAARFRRARQTPARRALTRETALGAGDLIWPIFVCEGSGETQAVPSMPGVVRRSVDLAAKAAREAADLGIPAICLFPYTKSAPATAPRRGTPTT